MTETPMTPDVAMARLQQYEERPAPTWSTASYGGNAAEGTLAEIGRTLADEVTRLRGELAATQRAKAENDDRFQAAYTEQRYRADAAEKRLHDAAMTRVWTNEDGKKFVFVEDIAPHLLGTGRGEGRD